MPNSPAEVRSLQGFAAKVRKVRRRPRHFYPRSRGLQGTRAPGVSDHVDFFVGPCPLALRRIRPMTHVVVQPCFGCKYTMRCLSAGGMLLRRRADASTFIR